MKTQGIDVSSSPHQKKTAQHYKPLMESTHFYFRRSQNYAFPEEQEHEKGLGNTFKSIAHGLITETEAGRG